MTNVREGVFRPYLRIAVKSVKRTQGDKGQAEIDLDLKNDASAPDFHSIISGFPINNWLDLQ